MDAQLVLGCHGARRYGFSLCRGVSNVVVDLRKLGNQEQEALDYFDGHCKLFDTVQEDRNLVLSVLNYIEQKELAPKHIRDMMYEFVKLHQQCGLYCFIETIK